MWQRAIDKQLLAHTRAALEDRHPLAVVQLASTAVSLSASGQGTDAPGRGGLRRPAGPGPQVEATSLLAAVAELLELPPHLRTTVSRAIALRRKDLPRLLRGDLAVAVEGVGPCASRWGTSRTSRSARGWRTEPR